MEDGIYLECDHDDPCLWPRCGPAGTCQRCPDPVISIHTYWDVDHLVFHPVRHTEVYMSEPPFCAHCGGTCKCDDWKDHDDLDGEG